MLLVVYGATFFVADRLAFAPVKDERHFLETSRSFSAPFGVDALRSYPEVVTPLSLVVWGGLERVTGNGLRAGRLLNLVLSFALVSTIAFVRRFSWRTTAPAAVGMLLFPYTLPMSVHLYTDVMATTLGVLGVALLVKDAPAAAFAAFSAAIATRQYLVQVPAAFVAYEGLRLLRGERRVWRRAVASGAAAATLLGWIAFFGGLAPKAGMDVWVPRYPAPMLEWSGFIVHYGLYSLAGIGAYFVLLEAILFREIPTRKDLVKPRHLVLALVLGVLFVWDPPVLTASHPGGPIGRISRILFPPPAFDFVRVGMYYLLALAAVLRFSLRVDAASWIVLAGAVLSMKQQIPWEKYLMPTLACLWLLRAAGELLPYGAGAASRSASKGLTTQASPISRLST